MVQMFANMTDPSKLGPSWQPRCSPPFTARWWQPVLPADRRQAARQAIGTKRQSHADYRRHPDDQGFQESTLVREMLLAYTCRRNTAKKTANPSRR